MTQITPAPKSALSPAMVAFLLALGPYERRGSSSVDYSTTKTTMNACKARGLVEQVRFTKPSGWTNTVWRLTPAGEAWYQANRPRISYGTKLDLSWQIQRLISAAFYADTAENSGVYGPYWEGLAPHLHERLAEVRSFRASRAGWDVKNSRTLVEAMDLGDKAMTALFRDDLAGATHVLEALRAVVAQRVAERARDEAWKKAHGFCFRERVGWTADEFAGGLGAPGYRNDSEEGTEEVLP